jgi:transcription elongation GreA/GreB family factor
MKAFTTTNITMLERSLNTTLVPSKSKKSNKSVVIRLGASVSINVVNKKF